MANKHSVTDDGDPRKYYAAIPNIVLTLGLHPFELALYAYLKKVAGEDGTCWKSRATIAKEIKMSAGMVTKCKEALARPRQELNGKPLIVVTEHMQNGGNANHSITITDIWPENMAELERVRLEKARSHGDGDTSTRSPHDARGHTVTSTRSPHDHKEEPIKKNPEEDKRNFINELRSDPLYSHIDFDSEIERMRRWLERPQNKGRRMTERFVVNWINKIDRPVDVPESPPTETIRARLEREAELRRKMGWDKLERTA